MNIYQRITQDHEKHRALMKKILETAGDSPERRDLFEKFKEEITSHANAEEQTLYAELIADSETQAQARHSVHEHEEADALIEELSEMDMSNGAWLQKFRQLKEELEHHMEEEEEEVFSQAKDVIAAKEAEKMTGEFEIRKQREKADA